MPKTLEKAIDELEKWMNLEQDNPDQPNNKTVAKLGLTIHYSPTSGVWQCFYGRRHFKKYTGIGETPLKAVLAKIELDNNL